MLLAIVFSISSSIYNLISLIWSVLLPSKASTSDTKLTFSLQLTTEESYPLPLSQCICLCPESDFLSGNTQLLLLQFFEYYRAKFAFNLPSQWISSIGIDCLPRDR